MMKTLGIANGPIHTIPAGIDEDELQITGNISGSRDTDVLIIGLKNPQLTKSKELIENAKMTAQEHSLSKERAAFHGILKKVIAGRNLDGAWKE